MKRGARHLALLATALLSMAVAAADIRVETEWAPVAVEKAAAARARANSADARVIRLDEPSAAKVAMPAARAGAPMQIGFERAVPELGNTALAAAQLAWQPIEEGGYVAAIRVHSPGAAALRLGLAIEALPAEAVLRFYAPDAREVFEARATEAAGRTPWWSPVVEGEALTMEIELPAGSVPAHVRMASPGISHLVTSASRNFALPKVASTCTIDASCHQDQWSAQSAATARIVFTREAVTYVCTGTLVADEDPGTSIPYFHTANHCITTQADASSMVTYWFLRASTCGATTPGPYRSLQGGATLLYSGGATDTTLVRLNETPPTGVAYAGWFVGAPAPRDSPAASLHHAKGDLLKISFGTITGYATCTPPENNDFRCFNASANASQFYFARWTLQGITEGGSSGGGLFLDGGGRYLVGHLYGGESTCDTPANDIYGRFDVAYRDGMNAWLSATPSTNPYLPAYDYSDLWWNSAESGWGISVTQHASRQIFTAWYAYDADGRPLWVVMSGGQWTSPTTFTGDLYTTSGPDPTGAFDPASVVVTRAGSGTLTFDSRGAGSLAYTVQGVSGSRPITRQPFGADDPTPTANYNDLWWNPQESGWGVSINQQNRTLFAVWYTYGVDRQPVWYVMSGGAWTSNEAYTGTLYRTSRPPSPYFGNAPFDPASVTVTPVGSLTFTFQGTNAATMDYTLGSVTGRKSIIRQSF